MTSRFFRISMVWVIVLYAFLSAQPARVMHSGELQLALKKLTVLGSALYLAAHPDDENTAVLAYLSRGRLMRTGYLSLTRGDGGQNLIGDEKGDLLGVIRTRELLAARGIDGAAQFFSRAVDFGYSKSPEETMRIWGKEAILSDAVWVIRKFRPDVIITRFTPELGGHGHHRASATIAEEAFRAAGDPQRFPEQLTEATVWQPRQLLWDAWPPGIEQQGLDTTRVIRENIGGYNPLLGKSYGELMAESRNMHKSQGFGSRARRANWPARFYHTDGRPAGQDLFKGIDISWERAPDSQNIREPLEEALRQFDPQHPAAIIPLLLKARRAMTAQPASFWIREKLPDLDEVIRSCAGLWIEAVSEKYSASPGDSVKLTAMLVNRSDLPITLKSIRWPGEAEATQSRRALPPGEPVELQGSFVVPSAGKGDDLAIYSQPYWLIRPHTAGLFSLPSPGDAGMAVAPPKYPVAVELDISGETLTFTTAVFYRWRDPVAGERYRPLEILPPATVNFEDKFVLFNSTAPRTVRATIASVRGNISGTIDFHIGQGWKVEPARYAFSFEQPNRQTALQLRITPPARKNSGVLKARLTLAGEPAAGAISLTRIRYDHIPYQVYLAPARLALERFDLVAAGKRIGYIMGSGDEVPRALELVGYRVELLDDQDLLKADLAKFDAIITGIRAYNTREALAHAQARLLAYVEQGGTLICQYNVSRGLVVEQPGPYPIKLSRNRVTVEAAPVEILLPDHPLFTFPNRITPADFEGWVQERGLYFPSQWDSAYQPLLSSHDPGEEASAGLLLYASYGQGRYIYTPISWFRQLPAGVPGAFRLFVNLVSAGQPRNTAIGNPSGRAGSAR